MVLWRFLFQEFLTVMAPVKALVSKLTGRTCGDRSMEITGTPWTRPNRAFRWRSIALRLLAWTPSRPLLQHAG